MSWDDIMLIVEILGTTFITTIAFGIMMFIGFFMLGIAACVRRGFEKDEDEDEHDKISNDLEEE